MCAATCLGNGRYPFVACCNECSCMHAQDVRRVFRAPTYTSVVATTLKSLSCTAIDRSMTARICSNSCLSIAPCAIFVCSSCTATVPTSSLSSLSTTTAPGMVAASGCVSAKLLPSVYRVVNRTDGSVAPSTSCVSFSGVYRYCDNHSGCLFCG